MPALIDGSVPPGGNKTLHMLFGYSTTLRIALASLSLW
jgi:hypothetical protein